MATHATAIGPGRTQRPGPIPHIGPGTDTSEGDPVAARPLRVIDSSAAIVRIEGARILRAGAGWRGVGLRLKSPDTGCTLFEVFLTAGDGRDLVIALLDEEDAIAAWRSAGEATLLPLLMQAPDGTVSTPYPQLGAVALGPFSLRRQHSFLKTRRPRFLVRRKGARLSIGRDLVRGEELFGGKGR